MENKHSVNLWGKLPEEIYSTTVAKISRKMNKEVIDKITSLSFFFTKKYGKKNVVFVINKTPFMDESGTVGGVITAYIPFDGDYLKQH